MTAGGVAWSWSLTYGARQGVSIAGAALMHGAGVCLVGVAQLVTSLMCVCACMCDPPLSLTSYFSFRPRRI